MGHWEKISGIEPKLTEPEPEAKITITSPKVRIRSQSKMVGVNEDEQSTFNKNIEEKTLESIDSIEELRREINTIKEENINLQQMNKLNK